MAAWWDATAAVEWPVECEGSRHRLRWRAGVLELEDHPELEAELALIGLGGPEPPCVAMYRLWHDAIEDGGFLAEWVEESRLSPSWFSWLAMALERMRAEGFHEFLRGLPPARAQRMGEFLHRYPVPLIDRAAATVSSRLVDGGDAAGPGTVTCHHAGSLLAAATASRLRRAFVDSVGGRQLAVGAAALVPLDISVRPVAEPTVTGRLGGPGRGVAIVTPEGWLHRVWAPGAAVIDGRLTLAMDHDPDAAEPTATAWSVDWGPPAGGGGQNPVGRGLRVVFLDGRWRPLPGE